MSGSRELQTLVEESENIILCWEKLQDNRNLPFYVEQIQIPRNSYIFLSEWLYFNMWLKAIEKSLLFTKKHFVMYCSQPRT